MNQRIKNLYQYWLRKGKWELDYNAGIKFFYYYFCLNILMANFSNENKDREMIVWLKTNSNPIKDAFYYHLENSNFVDWLEKLRQMSPINDDRGPNYESVSILDINSFDQIMEAIYKIRCNFFHGTKNLDEKRNKELVNYSTRILEKLMWTVNERIFKK